MAFCADRLMQGFVWQSRQVGAAMIDALPTLICNGRVRTGVLCKPIIRRVAMAQSAPNMPAWKTGRCNTDAVGANPGELTRGRGTAYSLLAHGRRSGGTYSCYGRNRRYPATRGLWQAAQSVPN